MPTGITLYPDCRERMPRWPKRSGPSPRRF